ncbi:hypothetical protein CONLIGDRAFT_688166 [Coniochaeta ligniaria NRRL 30616]|uniref:Uncharacterized protein n=1 Tax=Coniochaeta ligniaria NRRL 30616 TaxID=1408157 RepID=A0A1J7J3K1_9PEZI|nr:hypothetical protein CONLIGDRAFT_688166 [Coniochaeta ligniaria NRRL 30616]
MSGFDVHVGSWTNWSQGRIMGATLTLTRQDGDLLIAFLSFFVTLVGNRFWRLLCLVLHFSCSTDQPRDAPHHQRQAVLRNSSTAELGVFSLLMVAWSWRNIASRVWRRFGPVVLLSTVTAAAWILASGYSSRISSLSTTNEVLLKGDACGYLDPNKELDAGDILAYYWPWMGTMIENSARYVQACYEDDSTATVDCSTFTKPRIQSKIATNASCPFGGNICATDHNIVMDSGYLDSHEHFGLNTPKDQRFQFRHVVQCAPLITEGYISTHTYNATTGRDFTRYHYGSVRGAEVYNFTHEGSNHENTGQALGGQFYDASSVYKPIDELAGDWSGDLGICFLSSNAITFEGVPVEDPWYKTGTRLNATADNLPLPGGSTNVSVWVWDQPSHPLACRMSMQACNPNLPEGQQCSPLGGINDFVANAMSLYTEGTPGYELTKWLLEAVFVNAGMMDVPGTLNAEALLSRKTLIQGMQGPLPDNQWQLEVEFWHNTIVALWQLLFVEAVRGPPSGGIYDTWSSEPETDMERLLCRSQKIRNSNYSSFSLFGLYFIFIVGGLIVLLSWIIEPILACLHRRRAYSLLEWSTNDVLQLQRLAHEETGSGGGNWSGCASGVPVTGKDCLLSPLDISDQSHPRLLLSDGTIKRPVSSVLVPESPPMEVSGTTERLAVVPGIVEVSQMRNEDNHQEGATDAAGVLISEDDRCSLEDTSTELRKGDVQKSESVSMSVLPVN